MHARHDSDLSLFPYRNSIQVLFLPISDFPERRVMFILNFFKNLIYIHGVAGTIGLEQLDSGNEAGHVNDSVRIISAALRHMVEDGKVISEAPSECNQESKSFESGEQIIKYVVQNSFFNGHTTIIYAKVGGVAKSDTCDPDESASLCTVDLRVLEMLTTEKSSAT